ncbi:thiocillin family RiPP [Streptomyces sp. Li-HN-5-11]|uniref:thiocillin family RiPP n=1 Tax=Streptomyces sp. Li-HN-5-11 TaxID=3075432 RepID=UPI0028AB1465|nr:thiocillin family RiPP [Streptomyces sp. Li-HN-5-11]WNM29189.1 thiocillin family RiPP [Streptomyces sp. Li-HN-5-11]
MDTNEDVFDLYALDSELSIEELPQGNALGCWFSAASASSASCPASSASCVGSASTFG